MLCKDNYEKVRSMIALSYYARHWDNLTIEYII